MGDGVPHLIRRHTHPQAQPDPADPPARSSGIDYLALVEARHTEALARRIDYATLPAPTDPTSDTR